MKSGVNQQQSGQAFSQTSSPITSNNAFSSGNIQSKTPFSGSGSIFTQASTGNQSSINSTPFSATSSQQSSGGLFGTKLITTPFASSSQSLQSQTPTPFQNKGFSSNSNAPQFGQSTFGTSPINPAPVSTSSSTLFGSTQMQSGFGGQSQTGFRGQSQPVFGGQTQAAFGGQTQSGFGGQIQSGFSGQVQSGFGGMFGSTATNNTASSGGNVGNWGSSSFTSPSFTQMRK